MKKGNIVALFHAISGAGCFIASFTTRGQIGIAEEPIKTVGLIIFGIGIILFTFTVLHLQNAFRGNVDPVTETLVTTGPYHQVRHPLYLAMLIMCVGLAVGMRSVLGAAIAIAAFFPLSVYRAMLEEDALGKKFGKEWEIYRSKTKFMIPFLY
jgi:protein-S-isoprenylcysteine O-methyltransferase Ste14